MATDLLRAPSAPAARPIAATAPPRFGARRPVVVALGLWGGLIVVAHVWGDHLLRTGHRIQVHLPPLVGWIDPRFGIRVLPALALAAAGVAWGPSLAARLSWRQLVLVVALIAGLWAAALAFVDGTAGFTKPMLLRGEYIRDVPAVGSPGEFLSTFTDRLPGYHTHTQAHPPGMVLLLWGLDRVGLGGAGWAAAFVVVAGALAAPAALVALRAVAGEARGRAAAPFLVFAPAAVWMATTPDGLFAAVGAVGVALVAVAAGRAGRAGDRLAAAGGVCLGAAVYLSYGAVLLAPVAVGAALWRRPAGGGTTQRLRPVVLAAVGALAVAAVFTAAGFWWFDGLAATRRAYWAGVASRRPYGYFLLANLAAFAVVVGPAAAAGLARLRDRATWVLVGGGLTAVALADLSALSKAEVERIWLPFAPWVLLATAALAHRGRAPRCWLAAQIVVGLAVQVVIRTPW